MNATITARVFVFPNENVSFLYFLSNENRMMRRKRIEMETMLQLLVYPSFTALGRNWQLA